MYLHGHFAFTGQGLVSFAMCLPPACVVAFTCPLPSQPVECYSAPDYDMQSNEGAGAAQ